MAPSARCGVGRCHLGGATPPPGPHLAWTGRSGAFSRTNVRRAAVPHRFVSHFLEVSRVLSNSSALGTLGIDSARVTQHKPRGVCAP